MKIKAGLIQMDVRLGRAAENLAAAADGIQNLADRGADLILLAEMFSCGFDNSNLDVHAQRTPEILERLSELAGRLRVVIAGSVPEKKAGKIFNTLFVLDVDGRVAGSYRKVHLFSLTREPEYFGAGNKAVVCETSLGPLGLMICFDLRFPELCRTLALNGARIVLVPAQWPEARIGQWETLLRARAIENQLFVAACNRCGKDPGLAFGGRSMVIDPLGKAMVRAMGGENGPSTVMAKMDMKKIEDFRALIPCLKERVPQAYAY